MIPGSPEWGSLAESQGGVVLLGPLVGALWVSFAISAVPFREYV